MQLANCKWHEPILEENILCQRRSNVASVSFSCYTFLETIHLHVYKMYIHIYIINYIYNKLYTYTHAMFKVFSLSFRQTHHKPFGPVPTHPTHPTNQPSTPVQNEALRVDEKSLHASAMLVKEKIPYAPPHHQNLLCHCVRCPLLLFLLLLSFFLVEKNQQSQVFRV